MSFPDHSHHAVRRIVLPSGRTIEVIRYGQPADAEHERELHVCPQCDSSLVQPLSWSESGDGRCQLMLECPNCAWLESGTYDREQIEAFEDYLDDGLAVLIGDLQHLTEANMAAEVERFTAALNAGLILPEDF